MGPFMVIWGPLGCMGAFIPQKIAGLTYIVAKARNHVQYAGFVVKISILKNIRVEFMCLTW